jgi:hypothetical protein
LVTIAGSRGASFTVVAIKNGKWSSKSGSIDSSLLRTIAGVIESVAPTDPVIYLKSLQMPVPGLLRDLPPINHILLWLDKALRPEKKALNEPRQSYVVELSKRSTGLLRRYR